MPLISPLPPFPERLLPRSLRTCCFFSQETLCPTRAVPSLPCPPPRLHQSPPFLGLSLHRFIFLPGITLSRICLPVYWIFPRVSAKPSALLPGALPVLEDGRHQTHTYCGATTEGNLPRLLEELLSFLLSATPALPRVPSATAAVTVRPTPPPRPARPALPPGPSAAGPFRAASGPRGITGLVVRPRKGGGQAPQRRLPGTTTPTGQRYAAPAPTVSAATSLRVPAAAAGEGRKDGGRGRGQRQVWGAAPRVTAPVPHPGHHEELPRGVQHQPGSTGAHR